MEAMRCQDPEFIVAGTIESGKTHPLLQRLYQLHCKIPNLVSFICRKQKVDMRKSVLDQWEHEVLPYAVHDPRSPCKPYGGNNPSQYDWKNGGITYCFGMQEAKALLGARFDVGFICQMEQLTLEDFEFLSHRTGRAGNWRDSAGNPRGQVWADANPDVSQHWIPKRVREGKLTYFKTGFEDNIMFFRDGAYTAHGSRRVAHLKETITGIRRKRLIEAEWSNAEGVIFPEFDEEIHVIDKLPDDILNWRLYQGIDYGHSAPLVVVWIAHHRETDEMIVFREWRHSNTLIEDHIDMIHTYSKGMEIDLRICDHDSQMNHQLDAAGLGTDAADKTDGSILRGLDLIRSRLRKRTLKFYSKMAIKDDPILIDRNAPLNAITEFSLYRHKPIEKQTGDSTKDDLPMLGQSDHAIDAIRYVIDQVDTDIPLGFDVHVAEIDFKNWRTW